MPCSEPRGKGGRCNTSQSASQPLPNQPHGHLEDTDWTEALSSSKLGVLGITGIQTGAPQHFNFPCWRKPHPRFIIPKFFIFQDLQENMIMRLLKFQFGSPPYCVQTKVRHGLVADKALHGHLNSIVMTLPARPCSHFLLSSLQGCNQTVDLSLFLSVSLSLSLFSLSLSLHMTEQTWLSFALADVARIISFLACCCLRDRKIEIIY